MVRQSLCVLSLLALLAVLTAILAPFLTILHSSSSREMQRTMLPSNTSVQPDRDEDEDDDDGGDTVHDMILVRSYSSQVR